MFGATGTEKKEPARGGGPSATTQRPSAAQKKREECLPGSTKGRNEEIERLKTGSMKTNRQPNGNRRGPPNLASVLVGRTGSSRQQEASS